MKSICSPRLAMVYKDMLLCYTYTVLHIFRQVLFGAGNQSNHQNFEKSLLSYKYELIFIGMKQKKIQNGRLKKTSFSSSANSQYFFMKISWIGPWVLHFLPVFELFLSLCRTASRPYRLSHTNALRINQS